MGSTSTRSRAEAVTWTRFAGRRCPGADDRAARLRAGEPDDRAAARHLPVQPNPAAFLPSRTGTRSAATTARSSATSRPSGSPALTWFEIQLLGIPADQTLGLDSASCASPPKRVTADDGTKVTTDERAIFPYSVSAWTAQQNGTVTDLRGGAELRLRSTASRPRQRPSGTTRSRRFGTSPTR